MKQRKLKRLDVNYNERKRIYMMDKLIRNCDIKLKCKQRWEDMQSTDEDGIRYCEQCKNNVHFCFNDYELNEAIQNNWCVAIYHSNDESAITYVGEPTAKYSKNNQ